MPSQPLTTNQYPDLAMPFGTLVAAVVDSNVLASDATRFASGIDDHPPFLLQAASSGALRLFLPEGQEHELPGAAIKVACDMGVDPQRAMSVWRREYQPRIRIVPDGGRHIQDDRLSALAERDPSDLPIGRLASRLAPVVCLSDDHDLASTGLGFPIGGANGGLWAIAANGAWRSRDLSIVATRAMGSIAASAARTARAKPAVSLTVAAALTAGTWWVITRRDLDLFQLRRFLSNVGKGLAEQWEGGLQAERRLQDAVVDRHAPIRLEDRLARRLAVAPHAMTAAALLRSFGPYEQPTEDDLLEILNGDPAFVRLKGGRWQLGFTISGQPDLPHMDRTR